MNNIYYKNKEYIGSGSINNVLLLGNKTSEEINVVDMTVPKLNLLDYQIAGSVDRDIYNSIIALGWGDDVFDGKFIKVNLSQHGSWIDSGTTVSGYKVYNSSASYNVDNAWDTTKITFCGYSNFHCFVRSYAESNYDYVLVSTLNNDYLANCTSTSTMRSAYNNTTYTKAYTRGNQQDSIYTEVVFDNLDVFGTYYFYIIYQKDTSASSNSDRGYFYLPYNNISIV